MCIVHKKWEASRVTGAQKFSGDTVLEALELEKQGVIVKSRK